jgi:hypothetical protein
MSAAALRGHPDRHAPPESRTLIARRQHSLTDTLSADYAVCCRLPTRGGAMLYQVIFPIAAVVALVAANPNPKSPRRMET